MNIFQVDPIRPNIAQELAIIKRKAKKGKQPIYASIVIYLFKQHCLVKESFVQNYVWENHPKIHGKEPSNPLEKIC